MSHPQKVKVLFVCMGNICRSPTAEGVFRHLVQSLGLEHAIEIDSAGTHAYHVGEPPDRRSQAAAARRGYDLSPLRARLVGAADCAAYDYILVMDHENLETVQLRCPAEHAHKVQLFGHYSKRFPGEAVPDPYYGGGESFDDVLDRVEDAAEGLLDDILARRAPG